MTSRLLVAAQSLARTNPEFREALKRELQAVSKRAQTAGPLYGHDSPETAYVVDDYPYGFKLRTSIRYWLESSPSKGFRFVSQTMDPKTGRWNNPKKSTYVMLGGNMFIDSKGHVGWKGLSEYSDATEVAEFIKEFPKTNSPMLKKWIKAKIQLLEDMVSGKRKWTINGVVKEPSEDEIGRWRKELEVWQGL